MSPKNRLSPIERLALNEKHGNKEANRSYLDTYHQPSQLEQLEPRQLLAAFVVDTIADENDGVGVGGVSLRDAIEAANLAGGTDTITFDNAVFGSGVTITLGGTELAVTDDVVITGLSDTQIVVDADDDSRVLSVDSSASASLSYLTLSGGDAAASYGGAIRNYTGSTLTLDRILIQDSDAAVGAGIYNEGVLTVTNSTIRDNDADTIGGGGLFNQSGSLTISHSTISGNTAGDTIQGGAGLYLNDGNAIITNTTISGNTGGYYGGGIYLKNATATLTNNTLVGNSAVTAGGGIRNSSGSLTMHNSIVAGNTAASGGNIDGTVALGVNNLFGDPTEGTGGLTHGVDGNIVGDGGTLALSTSTILNPNLANNGGGVATHALVTDSPALDTGSNTEATNAGLTTDQRGESRVFNTTVDIGAFEAQDTLTTLVVDTLDDENDGDFSEGDLSLREAIIRANGSLGTQSITFAESLFVLNTATFTLNHTATETDQTSDLDIFSNLEMFADEGRTVVIDGGGNDRVLDILGTVTLSNLTITNGSVAEDDGLDSIGESGGGIRVQPDSVVNFSNLHIHNNTTDEYGGGIVFFQADATLSDLLVEENNGVAYAGGIEFWETTFSFSDSTIRNNTTDDFAGGIDVYESQGTASGLTIQGNDAASYGGGIYVYDSTFTLSESSVTGNTAEFGGGLYVDDAQVTVEGSTFSGNTAEDGGGAIYVDASTLTVTDTTISGNTSDEYGAGIYATDATVSVTGSTITGNNAAGEGGALYAEDSDTSIVNSTISGNTAGDEGGGLYADGGTLTVTNSTVSGNTSGDDGGGIYTFNAELSVVISTISGNTSTNYGGGIYSRESTVTVTNSTISGNTADTGAGIYLADVYGTGLIQNATITGNDATTAGGGIYLEDGTYDVTINNSIVAGNTAASDDSDIEGTGTLEGTSANNLVGDPDTNGGLVDSVNGNIVGDGTATIDINTILETTLKDNGGATFTHDLVILSPALNNGSNLLVATDIQDLDNDSDVSELIPIDQRGNGRIKNLTVDIGAAEFSPSGIFSNIRAPRAILTGEEFRGNFQARIINDSGIDFLRSGDLSIRLVARPTDNSGDIVLSESDIRGDWLNGRSKNARFNIRTSSLAVGEYQFFAEVSYVNVGLSQNEILITSLDAESTPFILTVDNNSFLDLVGHTRLVKGAGQSVQAGDKTVQLLLYIRNHGNATQPSARIDITVHAEDVFGNRLADPLATFEDVKIPNLKPTGRVNKRFKLQFPAGITPDDYRIVVEVDSSNDVVESNPNGTGESNNVATTEDFIEVTEGNIDLRGEISDNKGTPQYAGGSEINDTRKIALFNDGTVATPQRGVLDLRVDVYNSSDALVATQLFDDMRLSRIRVDGSKQINMRLELPILGADSYRAVVNIIPQNFTDSVSSNDTFEFFFDVV